MRRTLLCLMIAAGTGCSSPPLAGEAGGSAAAIRAGALASARVWQPPAAPVADADLRGNPPGAWISPDEELACRFTQEVVGGTTPKFYCELANGEVVKIKYGARNPELPAEVAATRLLTALGFWTDRMFVVRSVKCQGCPRFPFKALKCAEATGLDSLCYAGASADSTMTFPFAVVERRLEGRVIETFEDEGWGWYELTAVDAARGGSTRAEVDALRLMAVFLAHWDNKAPNQRLVCPPGADRADGGCGRPLAIMQDLGATFGPLKMDLHNWRSGRIWKDQETCAVSMEQMPWGGATFPEGRISEEGRQLLLGLLIQLTAAQLRDLFEGSRATAVSQFTAESASVAAWIEAFKSRVEQIRDAGPCAGQP